MQSSECRQKPEQVYGVSGERRAICVFLEIQSCSLLRENFDPRDFPGMGFNGIAKEFSTRNDKNVKLQEYKMEKKTDVTFGNNKFSPRGLITEIFDVENEMLSDGRNEISIERNWQRNPRSFYASR